MESVDDSELRALQKKLLDGFVGSSLAPCVSEADVSAFEDVHRIELPAEYRAFITKIGNGCSELFGLGEMEDGTHWSQNDGFIGELAKPFPFTDVYNDLRSFPEYEEERAHDPEWIAAYEARRDSFDKIYFRPLDGAIPISELGCAISEWLIITGPERGNIWHDDRANLEGLRPYRGSDSPRLSFLEWCKGWPNG
jgi:hypothetical protein